MFKLTRTPNKFVMLLPDSFGPESGQTWLGCKLAASGSMDAIFLVILRRKTTWIFMELKYLNASLSINIFPNNNSFGVFSRSKGFGAELLSDSLWFSGADPSWAPKRFRSGFPSWAAKKFLWKVPGVLCGKWLSPPNRFFGVFPNLFSIYSFSSLLRFLGQMAVALEKVAWRVPQLCFTLVSQMAGEFRQLFDLSPSLLLGSKLHESLTCLTDTCHCCVGFLWAYFFVEVVTLLCTKRQHPILEVLLQKKIVGQW